MDTQVRLRWHVQRSFRDTGSYCDVAAHSDYDAAVAEARRESARNPEWHYVVWDDEDGHEAWVA